MNIKDIFEKNGEAMTYEQFETAMKEAGAKFVDLKEGQYVAKQKYDDDLSAKDSQITSLNETIGKRDTDLSALKKQLEDAGTDASKLTDLQSQFDTLKTKYDNDTAEYQNKLNKQAYEFAVRDYANDKKFTSKGARRDFERTMIEKSLQFDNGKILGADDFFAEYSKDNADAFVVEQPQTPDDSQKKPQFAGSTTPNNNDSGNTNPFKFDFLGVRPQK